MEKIQEANSELQDFNLAMLGREERLIGLKEEVNDLLWEQNQPLRYEAIWNEEQHMKKTMEKNVAW